MKKYFLLFGLLATVAYPQVIQKDNMWGSPNATTPRQETRQPKMIVPNGRNNVIVLDQNNVPLSAGNRDSSGNIYLVPLDNRD